MSVFLHALRLRNYRGIGFEAQTMPRFTKFNFFIGPNNSGKSTVLNFISRHLPIATMTNGGRPPDPLESHRGPNAGQIEMAIGMPIEHAHSELIGRLRALRDNTRAADVLKQLLVNVAVDGIVWMSSVIPYGEKLSLWVEPPKEMISALPPNDWQRLWMPLTSHSGGGDLRQNWLPGVIGAVEGALPIRLPATSLIPAIREIGPSGTDFTDFSGRGLINRLAELQSPDLDHRSDRVLFDRINGFLQTVVGRSDARIEIPHNRSHVLVHMDGRILPLTSLGTGIQEVIMIAAFCTISEEQIVCIEEPELHLHPLLQRKLVAYLDRNTSNQYFIATHSASFIDTPGAAIFHVHQVDGTTRISEALLRKERHAICVDLGHRASDLVQANAVVWVEGPSDRIYLKHWLSAAAPHLVEGIHYSIMFYGGRLLSHLSASDAEVSEFIELRTLNRHVAVVMDSDKSGPRARINETKARIKSEFEEGPGLAWITRGREIENYVPYDVLHAAIASLYGNAYAAPYSESAYDHALYFTRRHAPRASGSEPMIETKVDKVKVARTVCAQPAVLDVLDLRERIEDLVALIEEANI